MRTGSGPRRAASTTVLRASGRGDCASTKTARRASPGFLLSSAISRSSGITRSLCASSRLHERLHPQVGVDGRARGQNPSTGVGIVRRGGPGRGRPDAASARRGAARPASAAVGASASAGAALAAHRGGAAVRTASPAARRRRRGPARPGAARAEPAAPERAASRRAAAGAAPHSPQHVVPTQALRDLDAERARGAHPAALRETAARGGRSSGAPRRGRRPGARCARARRAPRRGSRPSHRRRRPASSAIARAHCSSAM